MKLFATSLALVSLFAASPVFAHDKAGHKHADGETCTDCANHDPKDCDQCEGKDGKCTKCGKKMTGKHCPHCKLKHKKDNHPTKTDGEPENKADAGHLDTPAK